jgi:hypothetical protein
MNTVIAALALASVALVTTVGCGGTAADAHRCGGDEVRGVWHVQCIGDDTPGNWQERSCTPGPKANGIRYWECQS